MPIRVLQTVAVSAGAATPVTTLPWIPLNVHTDTFNLQFSVNFPNATAGQLNYRVQGTLDNVLEAGVSAFAFNVLASGGGVDNGVYTQPITAIRLQVVSASASINGAFRVLQVGA